MSLLEGRIRRVGGLEPEEHFVDAYEAKMTRFFEDGTESDDHPRSRLPLANRRLVAAYTYRQMIFFGNGFARNCPIIAVYRAETTDEGLVIVFSTKPSRTPSLIEMGATGAHPTRFADALVKFRDDAVSQYPEMQTEAMRDHLRNIRGIPLRQILDQVTASPHGDSPDT
jgi:hypothetical protein